MRFRAHSVAVATGGRLVGLDVEIDGVSFDSRNVQAGQLFVPLIAERDGHEFIPGAIERGAAAYLTSRPAAGGTAIEVPDTLRSLMALAAAQRLTFDGPVIGITGSVGKTSTKDLAWAALAASLPTWANQAALLAKGDEPGFAALIGELVAGRRNR
jgi:UDP-N-acetylmuramoyl-tripeptide--D-alanyl-D-alanine ligase